MVKSFPSRSSFLCFSITFLFQDILTKEFILAHEDRKLVLSKNKLSFSLFLLLPSVTFEVDPRFHKLTNKIQQRLVIDGK